MQGESMQSRVIAVGAESKERMVTGQGMKEGVVST